MNMQAARMVPGASNNQLEAKTSSEIQDAPALTDKQTRPSEPEDLPPQIRESSTPATTASPVHSANSTSGLEPVQEAQAATAEPAGPDTKSAASSQAAKEHRRWWQLWHKTSE